MAWNYRIINHGDHLALHEVHYDDAGKPVSYTANAVTFVADPENGPQDIASALAHAAKDAVQYSILNATDFPS